MKKVFLFFALLGTFLGFCNSESVPHVSSSPHVSSVHISEPVHVSTPVEHISTPVEHISTPAERISVSTHEPIPMYRPIESLNESRIFINHNTTLYYYLVLNNHTHRYDTITAPTHEELRFKVVKLTESKEQKIGGIFIIIFIGLVAILAIALFAPSSKKQD